MGWEEDTAFSSEQDSHMDFRDKAGRSRHVSAEVDERQAAHVISSLLGIWAEIKWGATEDS